MTQPIEKEKTMMTRRKALKRLALAATALAAIPHAGAQTTEREYRALEKGQIPFALAPLPFSYDALEPHIDAQTMEIHFEGHHRAYVSSLNKAVAEIPQLYIGWKYKNPTENPIKNANQWLEDSLKNLDSVPESIRQTVRNSGGGHYNHSLFWQMLKKNGGGEPKGDLAMAIDKAFGSFVGFKTEFTKAALGQFGSGWVWLTLDAGTPRVEMTANQDTPLSAGRLVLLGLDVWEHAYYLKYQNRRADYVAAWFNIVNWEFVADRYLRLKG